MLLLLCFVLGWGLPRVYAVRFLPDEFGYWCYAARILGYDWSNLVSLEGYYSFGYSIILLPIMFFFQNAVCAYRVAIVVNAVLLAISGLGLYYIGCYLVTGENGGENGTSRMQMMLYASVAVFYPSYLFYMQVSLAETVLMTSYIMVCAMFISYIKNPTFFRMMGTIIMLLWMYSIHMRSVGVVIAFTISIMILFFQNKEHRKFSIGMLLLGLAGIFLLSQMKDYAKEILWTVADEKTLQINDYSGKWNIFTRIFSSTEEFKIFLLGILGKVYYLVGSTGGLFLWGMWYLVKKSVEALRDREKKGIILFFLLLSMLGVFGITAVAMRGGRIDGYFYGRYNEYVLAPVIICGILGLLELKRPCWKITALIGILVGVTTGLGHYILGLNSNRIATLHTVGIAAYTGNLQPSDWRFFAYVGVGFVINTVLVSVVILWSAGKKTEWDLRKNLYILLLIGEIALALGTSHSLNYWGQTLVYEEVGLADFLKERESKGDKIIYLNQNGGPWIGTIQFLQRDMKIQVAYPEEVEKWKGQDVIVTLAGKNPPEVLKEIYQKQRYGGTFVVYYNE